MSDTENTEVDPAETLAPPTNSRRFRSTVAEGRTTTATGSMADRLEASDSWAELDPEES